MLNKYSALLLGAMLGLGTMAFTGASASAAAMLPLSPIASGEANAANVGIVQVDHKKNWQKKNFNKCFYKNGDCYNKHRKKHRRHHRNNFDRSYLYLPLVIGGGYGAYDYYDDYDGGNLSSRHIRFCLKKYRSYNPRNNTWVSYSGRVKQCYSPYL